MYYTEIVTLKKLNFRHILRIFTYEKKTRMYLFLPKAIILLKYNFMITDFQEKVFLNKFNDRRCTFGFGFSRVTGIFEKVTDLLEHESGY